MATEQATPARISRWLGPLSGLAYVVLINVGNGLAAAGSPDVNASGEENLAYLRSNVGPKVTAGLALELLGFVAFVFFIGYLYRLLRNAEARDGWLSAVALIGGIATVSVKLSSLAAVIAADLRRDVLSADLARTLVDLSGGAFVVSWFTTGIFLLGIAASGLQTAVVPKAICWTGLLLAVGCLAGTVSPFAGPAVLPFVLSMLWTIALSLVLTRRSMRAAPGGQPAKGWAVEL